MLSNYLIKKVSKNSPDYKSDTVRTRLGYFAGVIGIIANLFLIKVTVDLFTGSISIMADAFNNLSDAASSIITIV
ncbi:hypothetical protein bsdtw1_00202 [Clostridium fungisolvens]|uniref:Cation efflux protein transmembrane domain-containing protein n=1 Tax=Clostridium fungisolvens TaxID=1604897 RepID=A0A6V8SA78_9CLOT|nr:hypothetical protein bsdtw1_00202 [Clostridium fungisolvens]